MYFIHPALAWGFLLVGVPVLIHLINMMRHRRVKWAAMEFLLASYKRHRNWVWLKQLLLLLMRMAAIAAAVAMLAQLTTPDRWSTLLGGKTTHHFILLDDSYSMSDTSGNARAYDRAMQVIRRIGSMAADQQTEQKITLLRFSQVAGPEDRGEQQKAAATQEAPIPLSSTYTADRDFDVWLEAHNREHDITQLAVGPQEALDVARQLVQDSPDENLVVYVVSDFRAREWENPASLKTTLRQLDEAGARINLVRCVQQARPNLAIMELVPAEGTQAAGVPLFINVKVRNFGTATARNVQLKIQSRYFDTDVDQHRKGQQPRGSVDELPVEPIESIGPGQTALRKIQAYFPGPGYHVIKASLPDDAVPTDNHRWCVIDFPISVPVLIVDGDTGQRGAFFLASAFEPGSRARTGIQPLVKTDAFLRDSRLEQLNAYQSIYLLDVPRLDMRAVRNLQEYVQQGGGLCIFLGPNVQRDFYHLFYDQGRGLFPVPLDRQDLLTPDIDEQSPDFHVVDHPVFRVFRGDRNPFVSGITISQYFRISEHWSPEPQSSTQVIARLRNRQPLVVERRYGDGYVLTFMTTITPQWNNWAHDPSYIVMLLDMQSHLAAPRRIQHPRMVGTPIDLELDPARYQGDLTFLAPGAIPDSPRTIDTRAIRVPATSESDGNANAGAANRRASLGRSPDGDRRSGETNFSGVYEARIATKDGANEIRRYALNVDGTEGDLALIPVRRLAEKLDPVRFEFHSSDDFGYAATDEAGTNWSSLILLFLVGWLLLEQLTAYAFSYHPVAGGGAR